MTCYCVCHRQEVGTPLPRFLLTLAVRALHFVIIFPDNILGDTALVENLEKTKKTAAEILNKVSEAKVTTVKIDEARELYRPAATRASLLYFILNQLNSINPIYQFSLKVRKSDHFLFNFFLNLSHHSCITFVH